MSKKEAKSKATVSDSSEDEEEEVKPKKRKMEKSSTSKAKSSKKEEEEEEETVFELSDKRRVSVREFRGKILIDIREFYNADGQMRPGKKGISLQLNQWEKLKDLITDIDEAIEEMK